MSIAGVSARVGSLHRPDKIYIVVLFSQNTFLHLSLNYFLKQPKNMIFYKKFNYQSGFVLKTVIPSGF